MVRRRPCRPGRQIPCLCTTGVTWNLGRVTLQPLGTVVDIDVLAPRVNDVRHPLGGLLERDVRVVRVRDPDWPIDLAFDLLRLRLPEDDPITTDLDRLLRLLRLLGLVGTGRRAGATEPAHHRSLLAIHRSTVRFLLARQLCDPPPWDFPPLIRDARRSLARSARPPRAHAPLGSHLIEGFQKGQRSPMIRTGRRRFGG